MQEVLATSGDAASEACTEFKIDATALQQGYHDQQSVLGCSVVYAED